MSTIAENLSGLSWGRVIVVLVVMTVAWYFMRRRADKIERDFFGDDESSYRADENGVSPFDRPPAGYEDLKAKEEQDALEKAKAGSTTKPLVKTLERKSVPKKASSEDAPPDEE